MTFETLHYPWIPSLVISLGGRNTPLLYLSRFRAAFHCRIFSTCVYARKSLYPVTFTNEITNEIKG